MQVFVAKSKKNFKVDKTIKWFKNEIAEIKRNMRLQVAGREGSVFSQMDQARLSQINILKKQMQEYIEMNYPEMA